MHPIEVHITTPDAPTAQAVAEALVAARLAVCVQVVPGVTSVYRWEGAVESATEHLLLVKSDARLFARLAEEVRARHPYEVPEIIALPVSEADAAYAAWWAEQLPLDG